VAQEKPGSIIRASESKERKMQVTLLEGVLELGDDLMVL
jgi:hypothetical protein